jgi:hypothetical protein
MGYACPVCETPQRDGEHLANHLAFTAMLRGGDHETWLSEHAPGWETEDPDTLAARVTDLAESAVYDEVFEDTTDDHAGHEHAGDHSDTAGDPRQHSPGQSARSTPAGRGYDQTADATTVDEVMAEARRRTAEMYGLDEDVDEGSEADERGRSNERSEAADQQTSDEET